MADKSNSIRASRQRPAQNDLRVSSTLFPDEAIRLIIDEWLVPAMLNDFLQTKILRTDVEQGHNGKAL